MGDERGYFVGRDGELAEARAAFDDALIGQGGLILLSGEPGIGKSHLARAIADEATTRGGRALWGTCWEAGGAPAFWPWVQAIRGYLGDQRESGAEAGSGVADLAQLLPGMRDAVDDAVPTAASDPDAARFRLFDAAARFLRTTAVDRPLVVVLDDLHAADAPSLLLLRFVAGELPRSRLLIVAAYRDDELRVGSPLSTAVAELGRREFTHRIALGGLSRRAVARYFELTTGGTPTPSLVAAIHTRTAGNPLFCRELARLLVADGRLDSTSASRLSLPPSVREVIGRRLRGLSDACLRVLSALSVLGREFRLDTMHLLTELDREASAPLLHEAVRSGVLVEVPDHPGRLRFAHALIRDGLYEDLPLARRLTLHRRAGEALEQLYGGHREPHLAELAHHFFEASGKDAEAKAVGYAAMAGDRAMESLAFEEAARLYELALRALESHNNPDEKACCALLVSVGEARGRAGDMPAAQQAFLAAAELAERRGLVEQLARAALGYGGRFVWEAGRGDPHLRPLLERALLAMGDQESALRARLLARLAGGPLRDDPNRDRRAALSAAAVDLARRLDDPATLAYVLDGRYAAIWWPDNLVERIAVADDLRRAASQAGDKEREFQARHYRCLASWEQGDMAGVVAELDGQARLAAELRQPAHDWYTMTVQATLALFEGRLDDAERLVPEAFIRGRSAQGSMAPAYFTIQRFLLSRECGELAAMADDVRQAAASFASYPVLRCIAAHTYAELGMATRARDSLEQLCAGNDVSVPFDDEWVFAVSLLADVAAFLGDTTRAAALYRALLPYSGRMAVSNPDGCVGAVARPLAVLAAACARWDDATRHFDEAIEANRKAGAGPWLIQTELDRARMLVARDRAGDREQAAVVAEKARDAARHRQWCALEAKAMELLGSVPATDATPGATGGSCVFRREGEYWSIAYGPDAVRLRDTKGLRYLAELLALPGRDVTALSLVTAVAGAEPSHQADLMAPLAASEGLTSTGMGDTGVLLDAQAKSAYRNRLTVLREELDEAERCHDLERATRARCEMEFLTDELSAALGLHGQSRRAAGPAERARQNVTKAIRAAIARIGEHSQALAEHLTATVHTGAVCRYQPDPRAPIRWQR